MSVIDNAGDNMRDRECDSIIGCTFFLNDLIGRIHDIILNLFPSGIMVGVSSPGTEIIELHLPFYGSRSEYDAMLRTFFAEHPHIHNCISLNSKAHIVGEFLLRNNKRDVQIMGYDMVAKNAECLREGSISFLIAQHGYQQGYSCVDTLFKAIVLKKKVQPVNYMPIELLTKENVDFYRRTQL